MSLLKTKNVIHSIVLLFTLIFTFPAFCVIGCSNSDSGDGGSGSGGDVDVETAYTGNTDAMLITSDNAKTVVTGANPNIASNLASGFIGGGQANGADRQSLSLTRLSMQTVLEYYNCFDVISFLLSDERSRTISDSDTFSCSDGGTQTATATTVTATQESGSIVYSDCTEEDITLSGNASYTIIFSSGDPDDWDSISITFNNTNMSYEGDSLTLYGTFTVSVADTVTTISFNLIETSTSGTSFWFRNYEIEETETTDYVEQTISGRFYNSADGYVIVSTPLTFQITTDTGVWTQGQLLAVGAQGADGDNTEALLTVTESDWTLNADTTGDGSYDYNLVNQSWDDF